MSTKEGLKKCEQLEVSQNIEAREIRVEKKF